VPLLYKSRLAAFCAEHGATLEHTARKNSADADMMLDRGEVTFHVEAGAIEVAGARRPNWHDKPRGTREECAGFSQRSRGALLWWLGTLDPAALPIFYTFTIPRELGLSPREAKAKLFTLLLRWEQTSHREICTLWKMEPQEDGTPHFHAFTWGVPFNAWQVVAVQWAEVLTGEHCGTPPVERGKRGAEVFREWVRSLPVSLVCKKALEASTRVEAIQTRNGVFSYAAKYIAKEFLAAWDKPGRFWGVRGRKYAPRSRRVRIVTDSKAAVRFKRCARRWLRSRGCMWGKGTRVRGVASVLQWMRCLVWAEGYAPPPHDFHARDGALCSGMALATL